MSLRIYLLTEILANNQAIIYSIRSAKEHRSLQLINLHRNLIYELPKAREIASIETLTLDLSC